MTKDDDRIIATVKDLLLRCDQRLDARHAATVRRHLCRALDMLESLEAAAAAALRRRRELQRREEQDARSYRQAFGTSESSN